MRGLEEIRNFREGRSGFGLKVGLSAGFWCETAQSPRLSTDCRLIFDGLEKEVCNPH